MSLEQRINRAWYGRPGWLHVLWPLEALYRAVVALRRRRRGNHPGVPVIVVGNLTVGGTGKTPLVIALVEVLRRRGCRPGIVSRGYGGRAAAYPLLVDRETLPEQAGDEPCLLARRTDVPVVVSPRRAEGAAWLVQQHGCDMVISDDGLQHYGLARDIEIVVVDGQRGFGNGHCLPVGPLREPERRLQDVDFRIINGAVAEPPAVSMWLRGNALVSLDGTRRVLPEQWPHARQVHAVAGIGNPQRFFETLRALGFAPYCHAFPDHHHYRSADLEFGDELPVIMTEKDAVKCRRFAAERCWELRVDAELDGDFHERLWRRLEELSEH